MVNFDKINAEQELWFCTAYYKDTVNGWCANKKGPFVKLQFTKKDFIEATPNQDHNVPVDVNTLKPDLQLSWMVRQVQNNRERLEAIEARLENNSNNSGEQESSFGQSDVSPIHVLLLLLVASVLLYMLIKQNRQQRELKQLSDEKKKLEESLNEKMAGARTVTPLNAAGMTEQQVNDLITRRLNELQNTFNRQNKVQTDSKKPNIVSTPKVASINTDQVVPDFDRKGFRIGTPSEAPIFRIYNKGNDYFYTLVDNEEVLRSLPATIAAFDDFLTYTVAGGNATKACAVNPGKLEKVGDFFVVDSANKLKVEFV